MDRAASNVLIDHLARERNRSLDLLWVIGFSLLTALAAQVEIRLPFTPVPITGQTFAVLLAGAVLGWRRGAASQLAYLAEGACGLPVFAGGAATLAHLISPTGGYLLSYPLAAGLVGWLIERGASRRVWQLALALVAGDAFILFSGTLWLRLVYGFGFMHSLVAGFYPFLIGDIAKVALVGLSLPRVLGRFERGN